MYLVISPLFNLVYPIETNNLFFKGELAKIGSSTYSYQWHVNTFAQTNVHIQMKNSIHKHKQADNIKEKKRNFVDSATFLALIQKSAKK